MAAISTPQYDLDAQLAAGLAVELLPGRLYFTSLGTQVPDGRGLRFLGPAPDMIYQPYFLDFGPLNLAHTVRYCRSVCEKLADASRHSGSSDACDVEGHGGDGIMTEVAASRRGVGGRCTSEASVKSSRADSPPSAASGRVYQHHTPPRGAAHGGAQGPAPDRVVLYSSLRTNERANTAFMAGCFCVAVLRFSPQHANRLFQGIYPHFLPFRDASYRLSNYCLHLVDCWSGFRRAFDLGWVSTGRWISAHTERLEVFRAVALSTDADATARCAAILAPYLPQPSGAGRTHSALPRSRPASSSSTVRGFAASAAGRAAVDSRERKSSASGSAGGLSAVASAFRLTDAVFSSAFAPGDVLLPYIRSAAPLLYAFDAAEYEHFDALENGDWNWLIPGQVLGFSGPVDAVPGRGAIHYVEMFRAKHVQTVIRLNERESYNELAFVNQGIRHLDCGFEDGSVPCDAVVSKFLTGLRGVVDHANVMGAYHLEVAERGLADIDEVCASFSGNSLSRSRPGTASMTATSTGGGGLRGVLPPRPKGPLSTGAVAVHCKAGLGRTGTLVAIYMMSTYGLTAREAIGWLRICRPGSVLGQQQEFLELYEGRLKRAGPSPATSAAPTSVRGLAALLKGGAVQSPDRGQRGAGHGGRPGRGPAGGHDDDRASSVSLPMNQRSATPHTASALASLHSLQRLGDPHQQRPYTVADHRCRSSHRASTAGPAAPPIIDGTNVYPRLASATAAPSSGAATAAQARDASARPISRNKVPAPLIGAAMSALAGPTVGSAAAVLGDRFLAPVAPKSRRSGRDPDAAAALRQLQRLALY